MSARRDARRRTDPAADTTVIPVELRAGACLEVWAPNDHWKARRRWSDARTAWLAHRGIHPQWDNFTEIPGVLRRGACMWSFDYLRLNRPERLAGKLAFHELRQDWIPIYVETYDYGPSTIPLNETWEAFTTRRAAAVREPRGCGGSPHPTK